MRVLSGLLLLLVFSVPALAQEEEDFPKEKKGAPPPKASKVCGTPECKQCPWLIKICFQVQSKGELTITFDDRCAGGDGCSCPCIKAYGFCPCKKQKCPKK